MVAPANKRVLLESDKAAPNGVATLDGSTKIPAGQLPDQSGTYVAVGQKGAASGVATLDGAGKVPAGQLPDQSGTYVAVTQRAAAGGVATLDGGGIVPDTQLPGRLGATTLADTFAPNVHRGTLATRPAAPVAGTEWIQTDTAGGNPAGTRSYYDGAVWTAVLPDQVAQVGCQSNSWFTTMPDPNPPATNMTFATPNAGANGISLSLFRLRKDITIASLVLRKATGAANYTQAIYRLDGTTLTRIATTGDLVNPNLDNNIRRDPLLSPVTLTAGTTYYYALTSGTGTFQYYQRSGGSIHTANMIGMVFGEATALYQSGTTFHPAPATVDTTVGTWLGWQNPPVHFGLAYT